MDVYCVITMISDEKYAEFLENLNIYHGQTFPFCKKDQVYKVINRDMCIVRVGDFWSTGDLLGYLSTEIELSNEDRLYCIPISSNPNGFTSIRHNWTYLEKLDDLDADKEYSSEHFRQARDIFYLVNYL